MKPTSAFSVVRWKNKILIIRDRRGRWTLPGGQINKGESGKTAAKRETFEETSIKVTVTKKSKKTKAYNKGKKRAVVYKSKTKTKKVTLSIEHIEFAWASPRQAVTMLIKRHAVALDYLIKGEKKYDTGRIQSRASCVSFEQEAHD